MTHPRKLARAVARSMFWSALGTGIVTSCEPQDIYLFDPPPEVEVRTDAGTDPPSDPGPSREPDAAPPRAPEQPPCTSPACVACVDQQLCVGRAQPSVCHPGSGLCSIACEPGEDAQNEGVGQCPPAERCDPTLELCVSCVDRSDCSGALPACDVRTGGCVECLERDDCPALRPVCDVANQRCIECAEDIDCAGTGEVCLTELARCVQCRDDSDCRGRVVGDDDEVPVCLPEELRCVECVDDSDCTSDPEKPFCSTRFDCEDERE